MKRILHVSAEAAPFARTGGLGDAAMGLARALAQSDSSSQVVLITPRYGNSRHYEQGIFWDEPVQVRVGSVELWVGVRQLPVDDHGLQVLMIEHDELFGGRDGIYGDAAGTYGDNPFRFAVLGAASLEIARRLWPEQGYDVLHAHDWHAAMSVLYARMDEWSRLRSSVLTVHNLAHQGVLPPSALGWLGVPWHWFREELLAHDGAVNLMKGAIALADRVTAVSPRYAWEVTTPSGGFGLDAHLSYHRDKLRGIVNGIDVQAYDPSTDQALPERYDVERVAHGKARAKQRARELLGLEATEAPLFAAIARFDAQKGLDVLFRCVPELVAWGGQLAVLGQGDPALEGWVRGLAAHHPGRVAARVGFDEPLSRLLYAAADFVLVPSRFEPCGLSQLYALRYGAVPIVSRTGGLLDTVRPFEWAALEDEAALVQTDRRGPGFFVTPGDDITLLEACVSACELSRDAGKMRQVRRWAMTRDWSWAGSAAQMLELYRSIR